MSLENGQVWCVPGSNAEAYKLGAEDISLYLKKNFLESEGVTILGSSAKIGALPANFVNDGEADKSTYIEITEENIGFKVNGEQKHVFNTDMVSITHGNGSICVDNNKVSLTRGNGEICINDKEVALKHHSDKTTIGLTGGSFYINGNKTQISEDLTNNKLNFYTELANAVYGNNTIYLEFYEDLSLIHI